MVDEPAAGIPIFETPDTSDLVPLRRAPRGWVEQIGASWEAQRHIENINQSRRNDLETYSARIEEIREATGVRLDHPLIINDPRERTLEASRARTFERRVEELRASNPEYATAIGSRDAWEERRRARIQAIDEDAQDLEFLPALTGGILGSFEDPLNLITLPVGGGKSVLTVAAREAGLNAFVEALSLPAGQRWRREMGLDELTPGDMAFRVGVGAAFGGVVGGGGRAFEVHAAPRISQAWNQLPFNRQAEALRELAPDNPEARTIADLLDREAEIDASNPLGPGLEADAAHREFLDWGREAAEGGELSPGNPYRPLEVQPSVARAASVEEDLFVRAARMGEALPDELTSFRQVRAASQERIGEWYDRNVIEVQRSDGSLHLSIDHPDGPMRMNVAQYAPGRAGVAFTLNDAHARAGGPPTREGVARGQRTMARAAATLSGLVNRRADNHLIQFTGATPAHDRFYRSVLAGFDNPEWRAYIGTDQHHFALARRGSGEEEDIVNGGYAAIEPRRSRRAESGGDDGRGNRGRAGGDGVRTADAGAARPADSAAADRIAAAAEGPARQSDLFDQPGGDGARRQLAQLEAEQRAYPDAAEGDLIPTGREVDGQAELRSRAEIEAEIDGQQSLLASLRSCALGGSGT